MKEKYRWNTRQKKTKRTNDTKEDKKKDRKMYQTELTKFKNPTSKPGSGSKAKMRRSKVERERERKNWKKIRPKLIKFFKLF